MDREPGLLRALAGASLVLLTGSALAAPYSFDTTPGRLPKDVVPIDYRIDLKPDAASLTLTGRETILLDFRKAAATLRFDSVNEKLSDVRLDGKPVRTTVSDDAAQLTTVTLAAAAPAGRHTLTFAYSGRIEEEARGLFAQQYRGADGKTSTLLSTQFESIDARRMFPCWDEPSFRATFLLRVTLPAEWTAVGNMPVTSRVVKDRLATTTFARSPQMASYLLELTAGDIASIGSNAGGKQINVWAVRGHEQEGAWALDNARTILADYGDYFGYPFPLPKLDLIAIPGGWSGAMENWGAITYMDSLLLVTPQTTLRGRQIAYSVQAHEMSHQWFGDLVTMAWWDEEWLNESMTFWMEAKETALRHPEWHWWEQADADKEAAMTVDSQANAEAIHVHVTDELAASGAYDQDVVGGKGQTVMRMFEAFLGPETFRAGLRSYMQARALSNATAADLWNALSSASGQDIAAIIGPWAETPGYPLVSVTAHCAADGLRTIALSQRRFLLNGADGSATHWSIPLRIRAGAAAEARSLLLKDDGQSVVAGSCDEPLSINADGLGYYRASYDPPTLAANTRSFATLPDADRIALLDDQWAMAESGSAPLSAYLALAQGMGQSLNTRAWQQVERSLGRIERAERGKPGHDAFAAYARKLLAAPFAQLGWDARAGEGPDVQLLRHALIQDLGDWGDPAVLAEARRRYTAFLADHSRIAPDDQMVVLAVVGKHADAATYDQLLALARSASDPSQVQRYFMALAPVDDDQLAARTASLVVSDELPPQAAAMRFGMLAMVARSHPRQSWDVFRENAPKTMQAFGGMANELMAQNVPATYGEAVPLAELETWLRASIPADLAPVIGRGIEAARLKLAQDTALVQAADAYLK
jgi:aminopeptidase N